MENERLPILGIAIWKECKRIYLESEHVGEDGCYPVVESSYESFDEAVAKLSALIKRKDWKRP